MKKSNSKKTSKAATLKLIVINQSITKKHVSNSVH